MLHEAMAPPRRSMIQVDKDEVRCKWKLTHATGDGLSYHPV